MALGRGLSELLGEVETAYENSTTTSTDGVTELDVNHIKANPNQPRKIFDETKLKELSDSIVKHGLLQAVSVIKVSNDEYILIAGERRLRAHKMASIDTIKATIIDVETAKADYQAIKEEYLKLLNAPLPSENIDNWIETNRKKFQDLAESYAASVNSNKPGMPVVDNPKAIAAAAKQAAAVEKEETRQLELRRNEMDSIRQSFLDKSALEKEQWDQRQQALNAWRDLELEERKGNNERIREIERKHTDLTLKNYKNHQENLSGIEDARNQVRLQSAEKVFDSMSGLAKVFSGEQSGIYKAMFVAQKAYSLASVLLSSKEAIGKAWASAAFPFNLPAVGMALAETGALKAAVSAISTPSFHTGGIAGQTADSNGTRLKNNEIYAKLLKNEEVVTQSDPRHRDNISTGGRSSAKQFIINITNSGEPVTATGFMDDAGQVQVFLERADEFIAGGIQSGHGLTSQAIEGILGGNRAKSAQR